MALRKKPNFCSVSYVRDKRGLHSCVECKWRYRPSDLFAFRLTDGLPRVCLHRDHIEFNFADGDQIYHNCDEFNADGECPHFEDLKRPMAKTGEVREESEDE